MRFRLWVLPMLVCGFALGAATAQSIQQPATAPSGAGNKSQQILDDAASLIKESRYQEAIERLQKAEATAPDDPGIHHYLGYALWKQDRWSAAEVEFQKARRLDPQNPYTLYFLARIAQSSQHPRESIAYYEGILKLGPPVYDTSQRLGQLYFDQGEFEEARQQVEAGLKQTPWNPALYYQLGKIDQHAGRAAAAREEFNSAARLKNASQVAVQHLMELDQATSAHESDRVSQLREELLREAAQDPEILQSAGVLLGRAGLYEEARDPLERSVKLDPNSFEAEYNLGLTLLRLQSDEAAEASLVSALKLQPTSVEANRALAVLYVNENRNLDAIGRLRAANEASPEDPKILSLLGQQYLQGHFVTEAIATLQSAVKAAPENVDVRFLLTEAYHAAHQFEQGLKVAEETVRLFPESGRASYEAAQEQAALGQYEAAESEAEAAAKKEPQLVDAWNLLGDLESKGGRYDQALDSFERARSLDGNSAEAARGVAENLIRLKRYPDALSELQEALKIHPQDAALYFSLTQAYARTGQSEEATKAAAAYQQLHNREAASQDAQNPRAYVPQP